MLTGYNKKIEESVSKKARKSNQNLSEEEKNKKWQYACKWYWNLFEEKNEKKHLYGREQHKSIVKDKKAEDSSIYKKLV